jgi:hypothetical protein
MCCYSLYRRYQYADKYINRRKECNANEGEGRVEQGITVTK